MAVDDLVGLIKDERWVGIGQRSECCEHGVRRIVYEMFRWEGSIIVSCPAGLRVHTRHNGSD